nr:hypothetical protein [Tanacetum cinerariifolium]
MRTSIGFSPINTATNKSHIFSCIRDFIVAFRVVEMDNKDETVSEDEMENEDEAEAGNDRDETENENDEDEAENENDGDE